MKKFFSLFLAWCARVYLLRTKPYIIGITWSVGKTTLRMIIAQMLRSQLPTCRVTTSEKNFNSEIGLCLAILDIQTYVPTLLSTMKTVFIAFFHAFLFPHRTDVLVLEYGIDHPGDMDILVKIARPHIAILTGIDIVHASYFTSPEDIFREKVKLLYSARDLVLWAYPLATYFTDQTFTSDVLSFALHEDENETDIWFNSYTQWRVDEAFGSDFIVCQWEDRVTKIHTNLLGHEHAWYISLAHEIMQIVALRQHIQIPHETTLDVQFMLQPGRMSWFPGKRGSLLLDSTYNASPKSMQMMISLITQVRQELFPDRLLVFCLWDMRELWELTDQAHRSLASSLVHADALFLCGEAMKQNTIPQLVALWYASHRLCWFETSFALGQAVDTYLSEQKELALVLFKWSQNTIFLEEAVTCILRYPEESKYVCRQDSRRKYKKWIR